VIRWIVSITCLLATFAVHASEPYDVVIYGGTSSGIVAAVQTAGMGKSALLVEPSRHLGGLTSGGLGATDIGNKVAIGGIAREFYQRIRKYYDDPAAWTWQKREEYIPPGSKVSQEDTLWKFEPHAASQVFRAMLDEAKVVTVMAERLQLKHGVRRNGVRIEAIVMESGRTFAGRMFIDATYEGDLMAEAGVSYTVGREGNQQYDETLNGVQTRQVFQHQFKKPIDPFVKPGDRSSGLLPGVHEGSPGEEGTADKRVQAYNFRMCLTNVPENRVPFPKPANYDPARYELLIRYLQAGWNEVFGNHKLMPNFKTDTNNHGAFSTDNIGMNYAYPEANYATRDKIIAEHRDYQLGLMWTLANDPHVPDHIRANVSQWGLAKDEFAESDHWPPQLYVREARRMVSDYVMTEHHCRGEQEANDSVGLAAYGMDSHNCQRYVDEQGHARNEGDVQVPVAGPYPISYRSIVPKRVECANLLVPICLSASHIAYGSIRMEPVFMVLGQSAATASCLAIDHQVDIQQLDYAFLRKRLLADLQRLKWQLPEKQ
jgi:hypothetical protein